MRWPLAVTMSILLTIFSSIQKPSIVGTNPTFGSLISDCCDIPYTHMDGDGINVFKLAMDGAYLICYEEQATPFLKDHKDFVFDSICISSYVMLVDQSAVTTIPNSCSDLLSTNTKVTLLSDDFDERLLLASMSYSMDGQNYDISTSLQLLRKLKQQQRLIQSNEPSSITICFESSANKFLQQHPSYKVVPFCNKPLAFKLGVMHKNTSLSCCFQPLEQEGYILDTSANQKRYTFINDPQSFLEKTKNAPRKFTRYVQRLRMFSSADHKEHILAFLSAIFLILIWNAFAMHRSLQPAVQSYNKAVTCMCVCWNLIALIKYQLPLSPFTRFLWYLYYIFFLGLPLCSFLIAMEINFDSTKKNNKKIYRPFIVLYVILLAFVLTNDFHHLVFDFDPNGNWSDIYTYKIVYYCIAAYCIVTFLSGTIILYQKSKKSPYKYVRLYPLLVAFLLISYNLGYMANIEYIRETNITFLYSLLAILFQEAALNCGYIPTNSYYKQLFTSAPLHMNLYDLNGNAVLSSSNAVKLTDDHIQTILHAKKLHLKITPDTILHSSCIHGGYVVYCEDIKYLNKLHESIDSTNQNLQKTNRMLQQERNIKQQKVISDFNVSLFTTLETNIKEKTNVLQKEIHSYIQSTTHSEAQLAYITLLLVHIKRRCNLFFIQKETSVMKSLELSIYLDELCEFALLNHVNCLARIQELDVLEVAIATQIYDILFALIEECMQTNATLISTVYQENDYIHLKVLSSKQISNKTIVHLPKTSITLQQKEVDEMYSLDFIFERGDCL